MRAVIGSVVAHALLAWLALGGGREGSPRAAATTAPTIALFEAPEPVEIEPVEIELVASTEGGGSARGDGPAASNERRPASSAGSPNTTPARVASTASRTRVADPDPRGAITIDDANGGATAGIDGSASSGRGGVGTGTGIGFGDGGSIARAELLAPPPAPRGEPPSKARPARLIYPTRQREVEDAELFIARVIVDDDGYVAGAKLVRGFGGRRDEVAGQMIWRFRYAPALDDAGRPTRSTLEQRFLVGP